VKTSDCKIHSLPLSPHLKACESLPALSERLAFLRRLRHELCANRGAIVDLLALLRPDCSRGELISSELAPLLDTCSFLEKKASKILRPRKLGRDGQPVWLWGVHSTVYHEPLGTILILAPGNYPLFLPFAQAAHAWAAGNRVWIKSAPGSLALHQLIRDIFLKAAGQESWLSLLGEDNSSFKASLPHVQKVVLVGSAQTGRVVLSQAAEALVPAVAELSGWDTVIIHPDADMDLAAKSVAFGLSLNRGQTCVAPRRILLRGPVEQFEESFKETMEARAHFPLSTTDLGLVREMQAQGARPLWASDGHGPVLMSRVSASNRLLKEENFGAIAVLKVVESDAEALRIARDCPFALGASLLGPEDWALELAHRVPAQVISVNDVIVPTADPRVPFGGSGRSGYGRTRGAEGLLEMTQTRTVCVRRGGSLDHLLPPGPLDDLIVEKFVVMAHSKKATQKLAAFIQMITGIARERLRKRRAGETRPRL
jgi:acyl-CoA reductase-like NAD-dependent aldehyde dehydrogenase